MKIVRPYIINEEKIGSYDSYAGSHSDYIDVYVNPKSVKRMSPWARAFHDQNGNFYIGDANSADETTDLVDTDHIRLINFVSANYFSSDVKTEWSRELKTWVNGICWQRLGNTKEFYLSESYGGEEDTIGEDEQEAINDIWERDLFLPGDVKFILKKIDHSMALNGIQNQYVPEI